MLRRLLRVLYKAVELDEQEFFLILSADFVLVGIDCCLRGRPDKSLFCIVMIIITVLAAIDCS